MEHSSEIGAAKGFSGPSSRGLADRTVHRLRWRTRTLDQFTICELADFVAGISLERRSGGRNGLEESTLPQSSRATTLELAATLGIPSRAALRLACAFELGRRAAASTRLARAPVRTPRDAFELVAGTLHGRDREVVVALYLDGRHRLLQLHEVSVGTATASLIHPREVFGPALRAGACAVVIAHNHPSGDPEPSAEDHGVTERLLAAGELVGVPLLDHIVVGGATFVSLRGRGAWVAAGASERRPSP